MPTVTNPSCSSSTLSSISVGIDPIMSNRPPHTAAGVETVFQGEGESGDFCAVTPPTPPASPSPASSSELELESNLEEVFNSCGQEFSSEGTVSVIPVGKLVSYLSSLVQVDSKEVKELSRMLDPAGDNIYIDQQFFVSVSKIWMEKVLNSTSKEAEVIMPRSVLTLKEVEQSNDEERQFVYQLERLRDENQELLKTISALEDSVTILTRDLGLSKNREEFTVVKLKNALAEQEKAEEAHLETKKINEQRYHLVLEKDKLIEEIESKNEELESEKKDIILVKKELNRMKEVEGVRKAELLEKEYTIEQILKDCERTQTELEMMTQAVDQEKLKNVTMSSELDAVRKQLAMIGTLEAEDDQVEGLSSSQMNDISDDEPVPEDVTEQLPETIHEEHGNFLVELENLVSEKDNTIKTVLKELELNKLELKKKEIELAKTKLEVRSEQLQNGELLSELKNHRQREGVKQSSEEDRLDFRQNNTFLELPVRLSPEPEGTDQESRNKNVFGLSEMDIFKMRKSKILGMLRKFFGEGNFCIEDIERELEDNDALLDLESEYLEEEAIVRDDEAVSEPGVWVMRRVCSSLLFLSIFVLMFSFLGGLEIDYQLYYPITWYFLRSTFGDVFPAPDVMLRYNSWSAGSEMSW